MTWPPVYEGLSAAVLDSENRVLGEEPIPGQVPVKAGDRIAFDDVTILIRHRGRLDRLAVRIPHGPMVGLHEAPGDQPRHYVLRGDTIEVNGHVDFLPPIQEKPW